MDINPLAKKNFDCLKKIQKEYNKLSNWTVDYENSYLVIADISDSYKESVRETYFKELFSLRFVFSNVKVPNESLDYLSSIHTVMRVYNDKPKYCYSGAIYEIIPHSFKVEAFNKVITFLDEDSLSMMRNLLYVLDNMNFQSVMMCFNALSLKIIKRSNESFNGPKNIKEAFERFNIDLGDVINGTIEDYWEAIVTKFDSFDHIYTDRFKYERDFYQDINFIYRLFFLLFFLYCGYEGGFLFSLEHEINIKDLKNKKINLYDFALENNLF